MSIFKKPSELQPKYAISAMIYGSPGSGKTTLACSAPGAVLLDYDGGATRIHGAHQVPTLQVRQWEQTAEAINEIKTDPDIKTVVVDTVGKMLAYMEDYIKRTNPKLRRDGGKGYDDALSIKGFGVRKVMFIDFIKTLTMSGRHVVFVAHEKEEKQGEETKVRPDIGGSSLSDLMKELDLVGYVELIGTQRTIAFDPTEKYYAKNTVNMPGKTIVPMLFDGEGNPTEDNTFMVGIIRAYQQRQANNIKQTGEFEMLCGIINQRVADIADAQGANAFVAWVGELTHIFNSKTYAQTKFAAKVKELGLTYDKETKTYADPQ